MQRRVVGAFGLTEPGAGTDAQGQQTFAVDEGDHWKLNGSKIFITNAGFADVFIIIAVTGFVTDKRGRKQKEISAFIVERTDPGFKVGKPEDKMGIRGSSTCELIMEDCIIPKDRLLGVKARASSWPWLPWTAAVSASLPGSGHCRGRHRRDRRLCQGAQAVWPLHRTVPEHPVRAGRDEGPR